MNTERNNICYSFRHVTKPFNVTQNIAINAASEENNIQKNEISILKSKPTKVQKQADIEESDETIEPFNRMKLIKENLFLLSEMDKLKQRNNTLGRKVYYLESLARVSARKKKNFK